MADDVVHPVARTPEEWAKALTALGARSFRAREVFQWIHRRGVLDPAAMSSLDASLRERLFEGATSVGAVEHVHTSSDETKKAVLMMRDGTRIETVLIPRVSGPRKFEGGMPRGGAEDEELDADIAALDGDEDEAGDAPTARARVTQCISSQVGCAMGCVFCASGVAGLKRHLGAEEIVGQVLLGRSILGPDEELRNIVFMGMGEPLHNYGAT